MEHTYLEDVVTERFNMSESETDDLTTSESNEHHATEENTQDTEEETNNVVQVDEEQREKLVRLPLGRIKTIIKMDPEVSLVNQEAVFLITKSAEFFIDSLTKEAYKYTAQAKKKVIQKRDVESAIDNVDALVFLEGTLD